MTPLDITAHSLMGFGIGYQYGDMKMKEDEVKQGKNYYNASFLQTGQIGALATVVSRIASNSLTGAPYVIVEIAAQVLPILLLPVNFLIASVKQKDYEKIADWWNTSESTYCHILPQNLSVTANEIAAFFAEHTGDIIRVALIVGVVALIALGDVVFSAGMLAGLAYQIIDQLGWVPREVSLFLETYLPIASLIGLLLGGGLLLKIYALMSLPSYLYPPFYQAMLEKVDQLCRYWLPKNIYGPTLAEINADLVEKKNLTFAEINEILNADDDAYQINPAHCSKSVIDVHQFPQDDDFDFLITAFKSIDWTQRYNLIKPRLADDEIFIDILVEKYPGIDDKEKFKEQIDHYIGELATEKGVTKEQFAAGWAREQLGHLVAVLKGEKRVKGSQRDLAEAIEDVKRIIAYLKKLDPMADRVDFEDALLKMSLEQGDYCARGIKRTANELRWTAVRKHLAVSLQKKDDDADPIKDFELGIRQALEEQRLSIVQGFYQTFMKEIYSSIPDNVKYDVHVFDIYRTFLSLGFYPLSEYEKDQFGFIQMPNWEMLSMLRPAFYKMYEPNLAVKPVRAKFFTDYLPKVIEANTSLSNAEKAEILEKIANPADSGWTEQAMGKKFQRLLFVMLGVMRKIDPNSTADYDIPQHILKGVGYYELQEARRQEDRFTHNYY